MDIQIKDFDTQYNICGEPVMIDGLVELVQQIQIILSLKRGSFIYDKNLGIDFSQINFENENAPKILEAMIKEGLVDETDGDVKVNYINKINSRYFAGITVVNNYESINTEVMIFE